MTTDYELIIIGGGPAGLAAGIYAGRYGMKTVILETGICGGQIKSTPFIENYLGVGKLSGLDLAENMKAHTKMFAEIREFYEVTEIVSTPDDPQGYLYLLKTTQGDLRTKGILLTMGVSHKKLEVPGEEKYTGRGVSYCATCDGFFFKEKKVMVIGGGGTALTEAIYLASIGCETYLVHRRDQFRAEEVLVNMAKEGGVSFILDTVVSEIKGDGNLVTGVTLKNAKTGEFSETTVDGIFVAIGDVPNNTLSKQLDLEHDRRGCIITDKEMRTSGTFIYAAGDLIGGIRQVQTATGEAVVAATTAYKDIKNPYWS